MEGEWDALVPYNLKCIADSFLEGILMITISNYQRMIQIPKRHHKHIPSSESKDGMTQEENHYINKQGL